MSTDFNFEVNHYGPWTSSRKFLNENYPLKSFSNKQGFSAILDRKPFEDWDIDEFETENFDGYLILFHDPFEMPTKSSQQFYTRTGNKMKFHAIPELVSTDDSILKLTVEE